MRVKIHCRCDRCSEITKINQVVVENEMIFSEYICDCGYIQKRILDEIIYCKSDEHKYN